jgi:hypothetical protein
MKLVPAVLCASLFAVSLGTSVGQKSNSSEFTLIISGNAAGHLSPCGCTKPMSGGLKRLATVVKRYKSQGKTVWLDTGSMVASASRQELMKAETYSELLGALKVDVVALGGLDANINQSVVASAKSLTKGQWIGSSFLKRKATVGALTFEYQSLSGEVRVGYRKTKLTVFNSDGAANVNRDRITPGSHLRGIVVAKFKNGILTGIQAIPLESKIPDDPSADKIYRNYLARVARAGLVDQTPRSSDEQFVGSEKCASCHQKEAERHFSTAHSRAFKTLVKDGHSEDPDCVVCHVVGPESVAGYYNKRTPQLEEVGCESCHGGGTNHSKEPRKFRMGSVGEKKCLSCHTPNTSPNFNFKTFWEKIRH